ncbi:MULTISPECIES: DUF6625 family protein [Methylomonas]|uniref:Glycosyl transferase n=2 Tax=Methylomonas TaxID=416 RepID=A0A126T311_9GAMM|nr:MULTISPECIES: DUF6625 family protein [Methylomonas]AMK76452.1 hypothetical protein JT25_008095 [Methylomonas denitrificans]OAH98710.1 hypothetical protein A1342_12835 [Methylomonas methanica]TCV88486.1 hypothetical protein EDE11_101276 [Methylomonas methanica]
MKIIIVNIYFGMLPKYFDLFLKSCGNNPSVDFLFFVDFEVPYELPQNVRFVRTTLHEVHARFQAEFEFPIALKSAYKLCDFRPAFGVLFADYFAEYQWWGHCDFDMVFGDLTPIIDVARQANYVKIFRRGHLSLYQNLSEVNGIYKSILGPLNYREVFSNDKFFLFDETSGIDKIFTMLNLPVFREELVADITPKSAFLSMTSHDNRWGQYFLWSNGKIKCVSQGGEMKEFLYIHLQKRQMNNQCFSFPDNQIDILINQFGFFNLSEGFKSSLICYSSFIPNFGHLRRYYLPRVIKHVKRKFL